MPTVLELLNISSDYLGKKGIESPRLNAELLLSHVLHCKRLNLYLSFDRPLSENEVDQYREFIRRRKDREPLQYIIGEVEFFGMNFKINNNVLIPRPETEILVETVVKENKDMSFNILDIGTGSGCIAIALAKNIPSSTVLGIDISLEALEVASSNAALNSVSNVSFEKVDIINEIPPGRYDIIVSNPPYVSIDDFDELEPELKMYEPKISLTDNADGTLFYNSICLKASSILNEKGKLYFELGMGLQNIVSNIMARNGFDDIRTFKDYQNIERIIAGTKK